MGALGLWVHKLLRQAVEAAPLRMVHAEATSVSSGARLYDDRRGLIHREMEISLSLVFL